MFQTLGWWVSPRWSAARFWAIDTMGEAASSDRPSAVAFHEARDGQIASLDLGPGADPEAIVQVSHAVGLTATEAASRVRRGARCASLTLENDVATVCWVSEQAEWLRELKLWFEPPADQAYVWDCETRARYRGHHLYSELLRRIVDDLTDQGYRRVWIATEIHNHRSARGVQRAGFNPVGLVTAFELLGFRRTRIAGDPTASPLAVEDLRRGLR
ncbi:MAG: GNAT family N-acetyltransferase [Chloroflexota bacterium]